MAKILIAEDEKNIQLLLQAQLKPYYQTLTAKNGEEALELLENEHIDLLITDIMMPKMDGFELIEALREEGFSMPVLMLTAKTAIGDKRTGFKTGADDYLTKPVNYEELLLRVEALLRRANISAERQLVIGHTTIDETSYTVTDGTLSLELPKKEFELLYKFLSYPGQIFTRVQLLDEIWGYDSDSGEDTIKTHVSRLRKKCANFAEFSIVTVKGLGYKGEITPEKIK